MFKKAKTIKAAVYLIIMNLDTKNIGQFLSERNLWDRPLRSLSTVELLDLCEVIVEALDPQEGFAMPYIDETGTLIIPFRAPRKYRHWQGGQSILETLQELGASDDVIRKYTKI